MALLLFFFLSGCRSPQEDSKSADSTTEDTPGEVLPRFALITVLDGVRVDEFTSTYASSLTGVSGEEWASEVWDQMVPHGTVVRSVYNSGITVTAASHAAMMTSRVVAFANCSADAISSYRPEFPTIFEEFRKKTELGEDDVQMFGNTFFLGALPSSIQPGYGNGASWEMLVSDEDTSQPVGNDTPVLNAIEAAIDAGPPRLMVVNFHNADLLGHAGEDYPGGVQTQSRLLAELWAWLETYHADYAEQLLWVIASDHGRHRAGDWNNHGDSCAGCRETPLVLMGGAVLGGVESTETMLHTDIAPTVASWLGVEMPYADGLVRNDLVPAAMTPSRAGEREVSASGECVAFRRLLSDFAHRSEVVVNGSVVSSPLALDAEAPVVYDGDTADYLFFRELTVDSSAIDWPWVPHMMRNQGGTWTDIGFPISTFSAFSHPVITESQGRLFVGWANNPDGESHDYTDIGVYMGTWTEAEGWNVNFYTTNFPMDPSIVWTPSGSLIAAATSIYIGEGNYFWRRVQLWRAEADELVLLATFQLEDMLEANIRVERPALTTNGEVVSLAMLGMDDDESSVFVVQSSDGGRTWGSTIEMPDLGDPLPHVTPVWDGETLIWGVYTDAGGAAVCRAVPGSLTGECMDLESPRLDSFSLTPGGMLAAVDIGVGQWEIQEKLW